MSDEYIKKFYKQDYQFLQCMMGEKSKNKPLLADKLGISWPTAKKKMILQNLLQYLPCISFLKNKSNMIF